MNVKLNFFIILKTNCLLRFKLKNHVSSDIMSLSVLDICLARGLPKCMRLPCVYDPIVIPQGIVNHFPDTLTR